MGRLQGPGWPPKLFLGKGLRQSCLRVRVRLDRDLGVRFCVNCLSCHSGVPASAVVVLLVGLLTPSCTIGESGSGPLNHAPIDPEYTGTWVVQYLPSESSCGDLGRRLETWRFLEDGPVEVRMYPDTNENGLFDDELLFTGQQDGVNLSLTGSYDCEGSETGCYFQADLEFITWGCLMGTVTQLKPDGCEETADVLVALIANPPSIDVSGVWQVNHVITWGTGLLELSIGAEFDEEWDIYQHTEGMWEGILEITDSEGRQFLGTVNNNQVILARSWSTGGVEYRYRYTNLLFDGALMEGDVFGTGFIEGPQEIAWDLVGSREEAGSSGLVFGGGGGEATGEAGCVELTDEHGQRIVVACPYGGGAQTHVPLEPGRWQVRHVGDARSLDVERGRWERLSLRRPEGKMRLSRARKR